ncbi:HAD family hydrolase [Helicobacter pylori]
MTHSPLEVDAVILDLDDTLIREHDFVLSGYAAVARDLAPTLGVPERAIGDALRGIYDSPDRSRAFDALLEPHGRPDLVRRCIDTYRGHAPSIHLTPSAELLLTELLGRVPVGVVTDGPLVMQEAKVTALGLRDRGVEIVCTDALGGRETWKPSPAGLVEALTRLDAAPHRAVYIADNPHKDFVATARAGVHSVRLRQPGQLHHDCEADPGGEPEQEVRDLRDVVTLLQLPPHPTPEHEFGHP